ncbi:hypothetical protein V2O64_06230 [Verrucomicrobiaceae bacterium 227]
MSVPKIMALRMGIYCVLIGYLVFDLFAIKGPIYRALNEPSLDREGAIVAAKADGIVARVYYRPIFRTQIEEAVKEYLWRRGRQPEETSASERKMLRELVLHELIDEELIKLQIKVTEREVYEISEERVAAAVALEQKRYPQNDVFEALAKRGGWQGEKERKLRVTARIQREDYLRKILRVEVSDDEAKAWFEAHREELSSATFADARASIIDALALQKRDDAWKLFRRNRLRFWAEGSIDIFEDVLFAEESG